MIHKTIVVASLMLAIPTAMAAASDSNDIVVKGLMKAKTGLYIHNDTALTEYPCVGPFMNFEGGPIPVPYTIIVDENSQEQGNECATTFEVRNESIHKSGRCTIEFANNIDNSEPNVNIIEETGSASCSANGTNITFDLK